MDISHIEHVGIAVPSLDEAIPFYENMLGFKCFAIEEVPDQKVRTAFFKPKSFSGIFRNLRHDIADRF